MADYEYNCWDVFLVLLTVPSPQSDEEKARFDSERSKLIQGMGSAIFRLGGHDANPLLAKLSKKREAIHCEVRKSLKMHSDEKFVMFWNGKTFETISDLNPREFAEMQELVVQEINRRED